MLERRYEAYKAIVVRPFFRDHFARLDRQVVLVDTLRALNAGPAVVADLETALTDITPVLPAGDNNVLTRLVARRIDRILFAATEADHIHSSEPRPARGGDEPAGGGCGAQGAFAGAETKSMAIASVRATRRAHDRGWRRSTR